MIVKDTLGVVSGRPNMVDHSQNCKMISSQGELLAVVRCVAVCLLGKRSAEECAGQIMATQNGLLVLVLPLVFHVNML